VEGVVHRPASRVSFAKELALELVGGLPLFTGLPRRRVFPKVADTRSSQNLRIVTYALFLWYDSNGLDLR
jgi:hypothetical protein